jgi:hypothetical protein
VRRPVFIVQQPSRMRTRPVQIQEAWLAPDPYQNARENTSDPRPELVNPDMPAPGAPPLLPPLLTPELQVSPSVPAARAR